MKKRHNLSMNAVKQQTETVIITYLGVGRKVIQVIEMSNEEFRASIEESHQAYANRLLASILQPGLDVD